MIFSSAVQQGQIRYLVAHRVLQITSLTFDPHRVFVLLNPIQYQDNLSRIMLFHTDLPLRNVCFDADTGAITGVLYWAWKKNTRQTWQMPTWLCDGDQLKWVSSDDILLHPNAI